MKKINTIAACLLASLLISGCGNNASPKQETTQNVTIKGTADINSAFWKWEKGLDGSYSVKLYLTYYLNDEDIQGTEYCFDVPVSKNTLKKNTCVDEGLDRYTATYVVDGITLQSNKDVVTSAKGHKFTIPFEDGDVHYLSCECGLIDYSTSYPHNYISDENNMTETCSECGHSHFTEEYLSNKITNINNTIDSFVLPTSLENAIDNLYANRNANAVIEALDENDSLEDARAKKLLGVAYDYETILDAGKYHSYKLDSTAADPYEINDGYEVDNSYGNLRTFNIPKTIPSRFVDNKEDHSYEGRPDNGIFDAQATIYNCFEIANFPEISSTTSEIGFELYVPVSGLEYRILGYRGFPATLSGRNYSYLNDDTPLTQGWNYISISDFALYKNITHIFIEIKDENGAIPSGDYKLSSIVAKRSVTISELQNEINNLPDVDNLKINCFEKVQNLYAIYSLIDSKLYKWISNANKLENSYAKINNKFSLPLSGSISIWNVSNNKYALEASTINGNSMYALNTTQTAFSGYMSGKDPIPCPNETIGFLTYQDGEKYFGYNGNAKMIMCANNWNELVTMTSIKIADNWMLHYLPLNSLDYLDVGADEIYSANYIRFKLSGLPFQSDNTNTIYISTLYSFDTSLI